METSKISKYEIWAYTEPIGEIMEEAIAKKVKITLLKTQISVNKIMWANDIVAANDDGIERLDNFKGITFEEIEIANKFWLLELWKLLAA